MGEVAKQNKYLSRLNMSEDEAITVYTFYIVAPGFFGGKCSTKSNISPFSNYTKWHNKYLQMGLGYDIEKMLEPVHQDINMIIKMKYQSYPPLNLTIYMSELVYYS